LQQKYLFSNINSEYLKAKNDEESLEKAVRVMMLGWAGSVELRDEIFLQICKQVNGNPNTMEVHYLLKLMAMIGSSFQISPRMIYPVLNFLLQKLNDQKERIETKLLAQYCFIRIARFFDRHARKSPLLEYELRCIQELRMIMVDVYFPSGSRMYIPLESYTSSAEAVEIMMKMMNFGHRADFFGLYLWVEKNGKLLEERFLEDEELVLDVYSSLEILKIDQNPKDCSISYKVFLRLRVFYKLNPDDIDSVSYYYSQNLHDFLSNKFPLNHEEVADLASYAILKDYGKKVNQKDQTVHINIEKYIPATKVDQEYTSNYWLAKVMNRCAVLPFELKRDCKRKFILLLGKSHFFMSYQFEVIYSNQVEGSSKKAVQNKSLLLIVRPLELLFAEVYTKKIIESWHFKAIIKWGTSSKNSFAMITGDNTSHIFNSSKASEIVYLIRAYSNLALGKPLKDKI
jgi:hypothetical protein